MALSGTLREFDLSNIFLLIEQDSKTGHLVVSSEEGRYDVIFKNGQIINTKSENEDIKDFTFKYLESVKRFSSNEIKELNSLFYNNLHLLSHELTSKGYMTPQELTTLVQTSIIDITCNLFTVTDGDYLFEAAPSVDKAQFLNVSVPANFVMLEAARRSDEWVNIGTVITDDTIFASHIHITPDQVHQPMGNFSLYAVSQINGNRTVGEICNSVFFSRFHVFKAIDDALKNGSITLVNTPDMPMRNIKRKVVNKEFKNYSKILLSSAFTSLVVISIFFSAKFLFNDILWKDIREKSYTETHKISIEKTEKKVDNAILLFTLQEGKKPSAYKELVKRGYVTNKDIKLYTRIKK
jgi:hypothetical protein